MQTRKQVTVTIAKLMLAALLLAAIAGFLGRQMGPGVPLTLLWIAVIGLAVLLVIAALVSLTVRRFISRQDGAGPLQSPEPAGKFGDALGRRYHGADAADALTGKQ